MEGLNWYRTSNGVRKVSRIDSDPGVFIQRRDYRWTKSSLNGTKGFGNPTIDTNVEQFIHGVNKKGPRCK